MLPKVRQVDLSTVLASEAYVLFYRKASEGELSESFSLSDLFLTSVCHRYGGGAKGGGEAKRSAQQVS